MVNYKHKYLEMKLKYINAKNKLKGGTPVSSIRGINGPSIMPLVVMTFNLNINIQKNTRPPHSKRGEREIFDSCIQNYGESFYCTQNALIFSANYERMIDGQRGVDALLLTECDEVKVLVAFLSSVNGDNYIGFQHPKNIHNRTEHRHRASAIIFKQDIVNHDDFILFDNILSNGNDYLNITKRKNGKDILCIRSCIIVYDLRFNIIYASIWLDHLGGGQRSLNLRVRCFEMINKLIGAQIGDKLEERIGRRRHPYGKPPRIIIGGDFNDHNAPKLYREEIPFDSFGHDYSIKVPNTGGDLHSCCHSSYDLTSDYIFDKEYSKAFWCGVPVNFDKNTQEKQSQLMSDHIPIVLETTT
jgi:hypothetical protein